MKLLLLASAGGAIGAGARHLVNVASARWLGPDFPWGTLTVNIVGSLMMGLLYEALVLHYDGSPELRTFLATGILGGFTTFSAFSLDVVVLAGRGATGLAVSYAAASVIVSILALLAGMAIARMALT